MKKINPIYLKEIRTGVRTKKQGWFYSYIMDISSFGLFFFMLYLMQELDSLDELIIQIS